MFRNQLKVAWRNLFSNKSQFFINIAGLSIGMAVAILIGLWILDEITYDHYHEHCGQIAQVEQNRTFSDGVHTDKAMPIPLAVQLRRIYGSDFKQVILSTWTNSHIIAFQEKKLSLKGSFMESAAPEMLTLKMVEGTRNGLADQSGVFLAESVARTLFGDSGALNKTVLLDDHVAVVTGVYRDLPYNTSFKDLFFIANWDAFVSTRPRVKNAYNDWGANSFQIFVQMADNADIKSTSTKIRGIKSEFNKDEANAKPEVFLFPMTRWHLYSEFKNGVNTGGAIQIVWLFGIIDVFILFLACINFMNLSTARSERRAKEVGIRKAIGSSRGQLIGQFFMESMLMSILAFFLSLILVFVSLPLFNDVANKRIHSPWGSPVFWLVGFGFSLVTGIIAGSYPALYLSSFEAVKVLKGTFKAGNKGTVARKSLVVLQFSVSVILIIGTIVVFRQIRYAMDRPVGYSRDGLIMVPGDTNLYGHVDAIRSELLRQGIISEMADASSYLTEVSKSGNGFLWNGKDPKMEEDFVLTAVSPLYGKTVGWQFIDGRDFKKDFLTDSAGLVVNETAAKYMGLKTPAGETILWNDKQYVILGVIKDMVMGSPYEPVKQTIFYLNPGGIINIRINPSVGAGTAISSIKNVFKKFAPSSLFDYKFASEEYARKFASEERVGKLATTFAILAIFISCLGLFAMASYMAEQRAREIGIRKVLGASVGGLWYLLSKDFVQLIVLSFIISAPVSYFLMYKWLQNYQYRSGVPWWAFLVTGIGVLLITLVTVSYQTIKASLTNPVKSLKSQ